MKPSQEYTRYTKSLWLAAGLLLGASFTHPWLWWLGLVGVGVFLTLIARSGKLRSVIIGSFLMGFVYYGFVVMWLWNVYPITEYQVSTKQQLLIIGVAWLLTVSALALAKVVLGGVLYYWRLTDQVFLVATLFVISDVLGALLYCLMSFGPGAIINARFSFGWPGYLLSEHGWLLPLAAVGGVFGLSFLYVTGALWLRRVWQRHRVYAIGLLAACVASAWLPVPWSQPPAQLPVATVETAFIDYATDSRSLAARREVLTEAIEAAVADGQEYIVLPEGSNFARFFPNDEEVLAYLATMSETDIVLVDSSWFKANEEESFIRARLYDTHTNAVYTFDKQYLVPQGEFMPALFAALMRMVGFAEEAEQFARINNGVPGPASEMVDWPAHLPGVLFCFESIDPFGVRRAADDGTRPFVAHIVSHAWFHEPRLLWHQLDQMLRVNSRFADTPVYQASNLYEAKQY